MKSNWEILNSVIHEDFIHNNQKSMTEIQKSFKMEIPIYAKNIDQYRLYKFDSCQKDLFPFFARKSGLKKICDYILLAEKGVNLYIFLIELKNGKGSSQKQLEASKSFIEYIIDSAKRIGENINTNFIFIRSIRICNKSLTKNGTSESGFEYDDNNHVNYNWSQFRIAALTH